MKAQDAVDAAVAYAVAEGNLAALGLLATIEGVRAITDEAVGTASISMGCSETELRLAPSFFEEQVRDERDSTWVILHELCHKVDLHLAIQGTDPLHRSPQRVNLLLDVLVNTKLDRVFLMGGSSLQRRLYPHDSWPECLLLGPRGLVRALRGADIPDPSPGQDVQQETAGQGRLTNQDLTLLSEHFGSLAVARPRQVARLLLDADSNPEPRGWLTRALRTVEVPDARAKKVVLVGSHGGAGACAPSNETELAGSEDDQREQRRPGIEPSTTRNIQVQRRSEVRAEARRRFLQAVRRAAMLDQESPEPCRETTAMPRPGRRDAAMLGCGVVPALWHPRGEGEPDGERVRIYLDVSGSFHRYLSLVQWLAGQLGHQAFRPLWAWSSSVWPLGENELRRGAFRGDPSATLIGPVLQHIPRSSKALIITDGCFHLEPWMERQVRRQSLDLVFLVFGGNQKVAMRLSGIAKEVLSVPEETT